MGLPRPSFQFVHPETYRGVEPAAATFEALEAQVEWIDLLGLDPDFEGFRHVWADLAHHHRDLWDNRDVSDEVGNLIDLGRRMTGLEYAKSRAHAGHVRRQFLETLGRWTPCSHRRRRTPRHARIRTMWR
ncbi:MAG: hypothetical protein ACRD0U_00130 [Acidimicrobiales bacterium]